jgi:hypothetical protein
MGAIFPISQSSVESLQLVGNSQFFSEYDLTHSPVSQSSVESLQLVGNSRFFSEYDMIHYMSLPFTAKGFKVLFYHGRLLGFVKTRNQLVDINRNYKESGYCERIKLQDHKINSLSVHYESRQTECNVFLSISRKTTKMLSYLR